MSLIQKIKDEITKILKDTKGNTDKLEAQLHEGVDNVAADHKESVQAANLRGPTKINSFSHETVKPVESEPKTAEEVLQDAQPVPPNSDVELNEGDVRNEDGSITRADGSVVNPDGTVTPAPEANSGEGQKTE